jgi:hypothetical protein
VVITYVVCTPATPGTISGDAAVCAGSSNTYSVAAVSGATGYTWTLPAGWSGSSTSTSITATAGAAGGAISVTADNACGSSEAQSLSITVNALPQVSFELTQEIVCSVPAQTFPLNTGTPTGGSYSGTGVFGTTFDASGLSEGDYVITYTYTDGEGCTSSATASVNVVVCTSIDDLQGTGRIAVYPNPFSNTVNLLMDGYSGRGIASLTDVQGKEIKSLVFDATSGAAQLTMDQLQCGVYFLRVTMNGKPIATQKLFRVD